MQRASMLVMSLRLRRLHEPAPAPHVHARCGRRVCTVGRRIIAGYLAWRPQTGTALGLH